MSVKPFCVLLALCFTFTAARTGFEWTFDSSDWRFSNRNASIVGKARVPGGVFSDLRASGIINEDPLRRYNDVAYRWVSEDDWTYAVTFNVNSSSVKLFNKQYIIFNGVDTISDVYLNKKLIGSTNNMFVKYTFSVKEYLNEGENFLEVIINSPVRVANNNFNNSLNKIPPFCVPKEYNGECHINYLRKMQSSFGWDWGPAFPSVGIWKSVKLVMFQEHALEYIKTETIPVNASHWLLKTDVYVKCFGSISDAKIKLTLNTKKNMLRKEQDCCNEICIQNEMHTTIELYVSMIDVNTWWPNGYGEQPLYNLSIEFITKHDFQLKTISIGFRTAELIQELIDKNDPKMGLSFYLKINGVPIFAKGTNYIPADIFPEKINDEGAISYLLSSAKRVHMNTIRVWGGGVYESDGFYRICDQLGIMIWQDMMFACNMYPANEHFLENVGVEIKQQIRRLQHHPSIVMWAGNNENEAALRGNWYGTRTNYSSFVSDYIALYVNTVKKIVSEEDTTRTYLVSSPTNGLKSEEENYIAENPYSALYGDVHYYNYEVNSWSTIFFPWTRFASEYGFQSLPAYQTLQNAFDETDLINFPSPALIHRQHLPLGYVFMLYQIEINLPVPPEPTVSDYVYLSQVVQARAIRIQTEWYRKHRNTLLKDGRGLTMGALYWQLNDVWQAPTWSSIDYDQRWKMLHYSALDFFSPIIVVPELEISNNLTIYLVSDILVDVKVVLNVEIYNWESNIPLATYISDTILLKKNSAQLILNENYFNWLKVLTNKCGLINDQQIRSCFLHTKLYYRNMTEASPSNYLFPTSFKKIIRHTPDISVSRIWQEKINEVNVELESTGIGLFVWLNVTQIYGYFNENGFIMLNKTKTVIYRSNKDISLKQFNLNISHLRTNYTV